MKETAYFDFSVFKNHVLSLMPSTPADYVVSKEHQNKTISLLEQAVGNRVFFFVSNLENFEIEHACGIEKWLGYSERDFSMKKYLDIIQPGNRKSVLIIAGQLYDTLCTGSMPVSTDMRYSSVVALKHYKGYYIVAHKISSPFQYDKKNRLTAHLDQFSIIGKYNGQTLEPEFFNISGSSEEERGQEILKKTKEFFKKMKLLSANELLVATKLAADPDLRPEQIAIYLSSVDKKVSTNDVNKYCHRILLKTKEFSQYDFRNTVEAIHYLKGIGVF